MVLLNHTKFRSPNWRLNKNFSPKEKKLVALATILVAILSPVLCLIVDLISLSVVYHHVLGLNTVHSQTFTTSWKYCGWLLRWSVPVVWSKFMVLQCEGRRNQIQVKSLFFHHSIWNTMIFDEQLFAIASISFSFLVCKLDNHSGKQLCL